MSEFIEDNFAVYRFGIKYNKFDHLAFGITLNFYKVYNLNLPCLVIDFYKYSYTFGWCEITDKKEIIK